MCREKGAAMLTGKLKTLNVARAKTPGMYGDGGGLYLQVTGAGAKSWVFRFWVPARDPATGESMRDPLTKKVIGTSREMGLGSFTVVSLEEARQKAIEARRLRERGVDPIEARQVVKQTAALEKAKALKFKDAATTYIAAHRAGWRNEKHAAQWTATLETYAYPTIGEVSVQAIDTGLVLKVLEPIWTTKPETAGRVRGRIESILDWAKARGYRAGENPARWKGHLDQLLPARAKVRKVKHHPALPYDEIPAFMSALRAQEGIAARALEFTILTIARTNETIEASWDEIGAREKLWTISAERMKAERDHRVPLSKRALAILEASMHDTSGGFLFPGGKAAQPLGNMAMLALLERMNKRRTAAGQPRWTDPKNGNKDIVPHGFRSTFRDWASECTNFPAEVVEMALAHAVGDKVEAAYRRGDLFDKRRRLMDAWAEFCGKPAAERGRVVPIRRGG
jgi:integrase